MLGVTIITLDNQILGYFAKHGAGDISRLDYAKRLFTAPMAIIGQAAGAASLPFFASLFGRNQFASFASPSTAPSRASSPSHSSAPPP